MYTIYSRAKYLGKGNSVTSINACYLSLDIYESCFYNRGLVSAKFRARTSEEELKEMFNEFGEVVAFRFFP